MARVSRSKAAAADFRTIAKYSLVTWGFPRAKAYVAALHDMFDKLGQFPGLGRDAGRVRPGYLRMECGSHRIFYQRDDHGALILRVLHERMDARRHLK